jgi:hypothetical protein
MMIMKSLPYLALATIILLMPSHAAEVFEVGPGRESELPRGKEADGIRGDFLLRSDKIEAVVSANATLRRANMSTFYGDDGVTPGCLFDLTIKGTNNDQLICYGPAGHGPVSYVRVVDGQSAIESVTTAAKNKGIYKRHEYRVADGDQGVWITTTLRNETDKADKVSLKDDFTRFNETGSADSIKWFDAVNPADKAGYALVVLKVTGMEKMADDVELAPGTEVTIERFLAVGTSALQAWGIAASKRDKSKLVTGKIVDENGKPVTTAKLVVKIGNSKVTAYPDAEGKLELLLPGKKREATASDMGRVDVPISINGDAFTVTMAAASRIHFDIKDVQGRSPPCKVMFAGGPGSPSPDLGPIMRAHGCKDQYHSERGDFTVPVAAGNYHVTVVHGSEYDSLEKDVELAQGAEFVFSGILKRSVETPGWISSDFHNHSTQSGDNICGTDDRLINIAAEQLEFCPTTEHNRIFDWAPSIERLGLSTYVKTICGIELTGRRQHINAFPFTPDFFTQDNGAPVWNDDPRITSLDLRRHQGENPLRWVQFNHPDLANDFVDRNGDGLADGGFVGVGDMIDAVETQNGITSSILEGAPYRVNRKPGALAAKAEQIREFIWLQLLNQGHRLVAVGVADAHSVYGNGVGGWHIYLPSSTDEPSKIDWAELSPHAKAGNILVTNGPFMTVSTPDGKMAGDDVSSPGGTPLKVKVQCANWLDISRVQVLVNGRPEPTLNFTRTTHPQMFKDGVVKFDETIAVKLKSDAHLIVVALGEQTFLTGGYGSSDWGKLHPCAYNNPIYVDVDGNGFKANGDTLDFDLPTMGISADKARELLVKAGKMEPLPALPPLNVPTK